MNSIIKIMRKQVLNCIQTPTSLKVAQSLVTLYVVTVWLSEHFWCLLVLLKKERKNESTWTHETKKAKYGMRIDIAAGAWLIILAGQRHLTRSRTWLSKSRSAKSLGL